MLWVGAAPSFSAWNGSALPSWEWVGSSSSWWEWPLSCSFLRFFLSQCWVSPFRVASSFFALGFAFPSWCGGRPFLLVVGLAFLVVGLALLFLGLRALAFSFSGLGWPFLFGVGVLPSLGGEGWGSFLGMGWNFFLDVEALSSLAVVGPSSRGGGPFLLRPAVGTSFGMGVAPFLFLLGSCNGLFLSK